MLRESLKTWNLKAWKTDEKSWPWQLFEAIGFPWHQKWGSTESHCGERFLKILQNESQTCYHPKKCVLLSQVEGIAPLINKCSVLYSSNLHLRNFLARTRTGYGYFLLIVQSTVGRHDSTLRVPPIGMIRATNNVDLLSCNRSLCPLGDLLHGNVASSFL